MSTYKVNFYGIKECEKQREIFFVYDIDEDQSVEPVYEETLRIKDEPD